MPFVFLLPATRGQRKVFLIPQMGFFSNTWSEANQKKAAKRIMPLVTANLLPVPIPTRRNVLVLQRAGAVAVIFSKWPVNTTEDYAGVLAFPDGEELLLRRSQFQVLKNCSRSDRHVLDRAF